MAIAGVASAIQDRLRQRMVDELHQRQIEAQMAAQDRGLALDEQRMQFDMNQASQPAPEPPPMVVGGRLVTRTGQVLYDPPAAPEKPAPPKGPFVVGGNLVDDKGGVIYTGPREPKAPTEEPLVAIVGPDGNPVLVPRSQAAGKRPASNREQNIRPSLGAEKNALNYFNRMLEAERNARGVEDDVSAWDTAMSGNIPLMPEFAENLLKSEKGQKYTQAQRMFTEARLRKESGAAIPENEFANDRRMNFKAVGDKPETLAQKRAARLTTMRGIGQTAGRALQEYYGDDATLDSILQEFAAKEAAAATGKPTAADLIKKYGGR